MSGREEADEARGLRAALRRVQPRGLWVAAGSGLLLLAAALVAWYLLLPASSASLSEPSGFRGRVIDIVTEQPIPGALIEAGGAFARTDAEGRYRLDLPAGTYWPHVTAPGYIGMTYPYQKLAKGEVRALDFELIPINIAPEQEEILRRKLPLGSPASPAAPALAAAEASPSWMTTTSVPATLRVLMPDGTVVEMGMDEYLKGVVPAEMYPHWPLEALKAQAVAARSYAASSRKHAHQGADVCTTVHCQAWRPVHYDTTDRAVEETHGVAAKYNGYVIPAYFHGHCDGHTRNSEDVWGGYLPFCRSVACPAPFTTLWGHGVGLCQEGARVLAQQGKSYQEILRHYYTGIQVVTPNPPQLRGGEVRPPSGHSYTPFVFRVTYSDGDGDPPAEAAVLIDGLSYRMSYAGGDHATAALYVYTTTLPVGNHNYRFYFDDGYGHTVAWPASGSVQGPVVREPGRDVPTPSPTATPAAGQTQGGTWLQSTAQDWQGGAFQGVEIAPLGNGALVLATGVLSGTYTSPVHAASLEFMAIGATWVAQLPPGAAMSLSVRASPDGAHWSPWAEFSAMDAERERDEPPFAELIFQTGRYLQYRLNLRRDAADKQPRLDSLTLIYLDSRWGPTAAEGRSQAVADAAYTGGPPIISRAAWGANESWMTWEPEYAPVKAFIIHHTVTSSGGADPAAVVRGIYYYHAVTRGWGDIAYNYLIDDRGNIYEGRTGGEGVVGGHAKNYNWGTIGIAVLGDYSSQAPSAAAVASLVELIAWKGNRHFVHPQQETFLIDRTLPTVMGHRDTSSQTTCPGDGLYALLPSVRRQVMSRMAQLPPNGEIVDPAPGALVRGVRQVTMRGSPAVNSLTLWIDGQQRATGSASPFTYLWNTAAWPDGPHQLRLVVRTPAGRTHEETISVQVDNTPPSGGISLPALLNRREVTLETPAQEAAQMQVSLGWLWEGERLRHEPGSGLAISDTAAINGSAWLGRARLDRAGWWYGPYTCELPHWRTYWAWFRLKVGDNSTSAKVARLDVADAEGQNIFVWRELAGNEFPYADRYVEFPLEFYYGSRPQTCQDPAAEDGLEFRTRFLAAADLALDRVQLFTLPVAYQPRLEITLPEGDGYKQVSVRYLDAAGNPSPAYTAETLLDTTPPVWLSAGGYILVQDPLSGMDVGSGEYAVSEDGQTWSGWRALAIEGAPGATTPLLVRVPQTTACFVRFRARDRAGNQSLSEPYQVGCATPTASPSPSPSPSATRAIGQALLLPLLLRERWLPMPTVTLPPYPLATTPAPTRTATPTPTATVTPFQAVASTVRIGGTIYDSLRGPSSPIADAEVAVSIPSQRAQFGTRSDAQGRYEVLWQPVSDLPETEINVMAARPGYALGWLSGRLAPLPLGGSAQITIDVGLLPLATSAATPTPTPTPAAMALYVYGRVYEGDGDPPQALPGADVTVFLTGYPSQSLISNEQGFYLARFAVTCPFAQPLRADVLARKEGYTPGVASGFVTECAPHTIRYLSVDVTLRRAR